MSERVRQMVRRLSLTCALAGLALLLAGVYLPAPMRLLIQISTKINNAAYWPLPRSRDGVYSNAANLSVLLFFACGCFLSITAIAKAATAQEMVKETKQNGAKFGRLLIAELAFLATLFFLAFSICTGDVFVRLPDFGGAIVLCVAVLVWPVLLVIAIRLGLILINWSRIKEDV